MQAGEAFWAGRDETFGTAIDKMMPGCLSPLPWMRQAQQNGGRFREGVAFRGSVIRDFEQKLGPYTRAWKASMEAEIAATESADRASAAVERLGAVVKDFRDRTKNDISSMKAASERVQNEVAQMDARYRKAQELLTSPEFERAIANAERLAAALESISRLSETKLSVAVFSGGR